MFVYDSLSVLGNTTWKKIFQATWKCFLLPFSCPIDKLIFIEDLSAFPQVRETFKDFSRKRSIRERELVCFERLKS